MEYGCYTSMRVEPGYQVRGLDRHLGRLVRDCAAIFGGALDPDAVRAALRRELDAKPLPVIARVTLTDPHLDIARLGAPANPAIHVTTRQAPRLPMPPLRVRTTMFTRQLAHIKHTGIMAALYQRRQAQLDGYDDALFVTPLGEIAEGVTWNIGFIRDDQVLWPGGDALTGVTATLLGASQVTPVHRDELGTMQAAFATNVSVAARPIAAIDDREFDVSHPALAALTERYLAIDGQPI
ncbi:MAG TPA: aminotransferase class IV [Streptosporangiaceae bacterium]|nr:aminotransferase class IV [Streptosporangiaceae bacterium]